MARWEPDAFGRLQRAAVELYGERGYDRTTVAEIAARAGLSERTYFRHFADKREVLFHGSGGLQESLLAAVRQAPADEPPLEAVTRGLRRIGSFLDKRRAPSRRRHEIIRSNPELQERELMKRGSLVIALTSALQQRGVDPRTAGLAAESGASIFHIAYERWVADGRDRPYAEHVDETLASLRDLTAPQAARG